MMRKDFRKFSGPNAQKDFADHSKALSKSHEELKAKSRSNGNSAAPIARNAYKQRKALQVELQKVANARGSWKLRYRRIREQPQHLRKMGTQ